MKPSPLRPAQDASRRRSCARCEVLDDELQRLREERDDLMLRLRTLELRDEAPRRSRRPTPIHVPTFAPSPPTSNLYPDGVPQGGPAAAMGTGSNVRREAHPSGFAPSGLLNPDFVHQRTQGVDVGAVAQMSPQQLDTLPYGMIVLDRDGRVVHYNDTESRLAQLPRERVIGRDFFGEIAPCTRVREFEGRFRELVERPHEVRFQSFDFVFRFAHSEQHVSILMVPAKRRGWFNLALVRRSVAAG
ncbi:MAG: PAS domain-containing protein [Myxococcota bacterium]